REGYHTSADDLRYYVEQVIDSTAENISSMLQDVRAMRHTEIEQRDTFGEAQLAHRIRDYLPEQGQLFVGNSLVVRLIDALSQLP
ncbi:hypothetical protein MJM04_29840, partial [Salmonella enterica subsp. enterica serovar Cerro]|nr:hypothetical protein [Salmonella enterica subsp. enterica serovar Cerro]